MLSELRTGTVVSSDGAINPGRTDKTGALIAADGHGRYIESVYRGNVFLASNSAVQALSGNSTTATGLILTNPAGSGRNLAILEIQVAVASLPAGQSSLILTGSNVTTATTVVHTTPLTVRNAFLGSAPTSGVGLVDSAATIPAANIFRVLGTGTAATVAASTAFPPFVKDETSGILMLAPGTVISLQALTTALSVVASIIWEELPL